MRLRLLTALAVALAAAGFFGFFRLRAYVTQDPRFCASCHQASAEFALWSGGQHGGVACQKCHHSTPEQGVQMLRSFLAGTRPGRSGEPHAPVEIGACASCHIAHDKSWVDVGASRGHRIHAIEQKIACVRCHAAGVHRFEPPAAACKSCHGEHAVRAAGMQQIHCFACHDFLSVASDLRPTRRDCLRCHRAEGVHPARFPEEGPMRFVCAACHKPHAPAGSERVACASCHKTIVTAGLHREPGHRDCAKCHRAHVWTSAPADCLRCHPTAPAHDGHLTCSSCHSWRGAPIPPRAARGS
jgi:hypothetical protein